MSDFDNFGDAFFDVSVINICADSYVTRAAKGILEGSSIRYDAKMKKYPKLIIFTLSIVGKNEDLIEVMNLISTFGSELGLILNFNHGRVVAHRELFQLFRM